MIGTGASSRKVLPASGLFRGSSLRSWITRGLNESSETVSGSGSVMPVGSFFLALHDYLAVQVQRTQYWVGAHLLPVASEKLQLEPAPILSGQKPQNHLTNTLLLQRGPHFGVL